MKQHPRALILLGVIVSWLPYLAVRVYWQYLFDSVPNAAHGEFSGPADYFLYRLLLGATVSTVVLLISFAFWRDTTPRSNEHNAQRALPPTRPSRTGCNSRIWWAGSLNLGF